MKTRTCWGKARVKLQMCSRASRAQCESSTSERTNLPDISDTDPQRLSFLVAAAIEIDVEVKQELLELRSTSTRLERLSEMLRLAVTSYEERARVHELAKGNGHSGKKIELE